MGSTFEAIAWARDIHLHPSPKSVLVALIHRIDIDGYCYPSQGLLAQDTGLSERTVRLCLKYLEQENLILRQRRQNGRQRHSDLIRVLIGGKQPSQPYHEWYTSNGASAWSDRVPTYRAARMRVARTRGSASRHECLCGDPAVIWVYDGTDPMELRSPDGVRYSAQPERYVALCNGCRDLFPVPMNRQVALDEQAGTSGEVEREVGINNTRKTGNTHALVTLVRDARASKEVRIDPPIAAQVLEGIIRLIPEMDEDILWTWYAEGSFNPPAYRDFPELATRADELIQAVHEELKKRLLNQGP